MVSSFIKMAQNNSRSFSAMQGTRPPTNSLSASDSKSEKYFRILIHKQRISPYNHLYFHPMLRMQGLWHLENPSENLPQWQRRHHAYTFGITWDAIVVDHLSGGTRERCTPESPKTEFIIPYSVSVGQDPHINTLYKKKVYLIRSDMCCFILNLGYFCSDRKPLQVPSSFECPLYGSFKINIWVLKNIAVAKWDFSYSIPSDAVHSHVMSPLDFKSSEFGW